MCRGELMVYPEISCHILKLLTLELLTVVRHYTLRSSELMEYFLNQKSYDAFTIGFWKCLQKDKFC